LKKRFEESYEDDMPEETGTERFDASYYERVYRVGGIRKFDTHWWANRYYARLAERLLRKTPGNRLLDTGCGQGFLLGQLKPHVEAWGTEISEYALQRCKVFAPRAKVILGDIETGIPPALAGQSFDVIIGRYLLEHLKDPAAAMARLASLVREGGYFFFSVPNTESPGVRLKGPEWFGYLDETHCSLLEPREWRQLVDRSGLSLERVFSDGLWDVPYIKKIPTILQYGIFSLPTIAAVFFVSTALPLSWGENLIAFAKKPSRPDHSAGPSEGMT
jgi:SAM-dependent methyltransferase